MQQISLDIQQCVQFTDQEQNIKAILATLSISRPQYSVHLKKLCPDNVLCYLDQDLFNNLYAHCLSDQIPKDFTSSIRFVDYKGNRIKDMPKDRDNNYMPDQQRGQISGIPKRLSEIIIPTQQDPLQDLVIIPITRQYKTLGFMSQNKKMNLTQELNELRAKLAGSQVWLLVDDSKLQEFKNILTTDYQQVMGQFQHVEAVQSDMSWCIAECIFGRDLHDTKPADDYVEILFHSSSYIHHVKAIDSKSHEYVLANVRNNSQGIRISVTKYPVQTVQILILGQISLNSEDLPFNVKQGLIGFQNTKYEQRKLEDNEHLELIIDLHNKVQDQEQIFDSVIKGDIVQVGSFQNSLSYIAKYSQLLTDKALEVGQSPDVLKLYNNMFIDQTNKLDRFHSSIKEHFFKTINKTIYSEQEETFGPTLKCQHPFQNNKGGFDNPFRPMMNVKSYQSTDLSLRRI